MNPRRLFSLLAFTALGVCLSCNTASDKEQLCNQTCDRAATCQEEHDIPYDDSECRRYCDENWQEIESAGCLERCQPEMECVYKKLELGACTANALKGASQLCEPEADGCFDCLRENDSDLTPWDLASGERFGGCNAYCEMMGACDATGIVDDDFLYACRIACRQIGEHMGDLIRCAETYEDCGDFNACMSGNDPSADGDAEDPSDGDYDPSGGDGDLPLTCEGYCRRMRECDGSGMITMHWVELCIDACAETDDEGNPIIKDSLVACVSQPACEDFMVCLTEAESSF
ncbi:MAG: hypothetical protein C4523_01780 [Myxococcales bacterium]|nr:MAG: hypothetical protein C4523_01780 [Myxococcales bacterium]